MYNVAVVGATGLIGRNIVRQLESRLFPVGSLILFASRHSAGQRMKFGGREIEVLELTEENVCKNRADIALFSAGGEIGKKYAPLFATLGTIVVDNSSAWRMNDSVPLVIPSVNSADVLMHTGIIANPNCSTIAAVIALAPLNKRFGLKKVVYSTYQAVSGAGMGGINDLKEGTRLKFPKAIAYNVIPQIDCEDRDGYTKEEIKMMDETRKILALPNLEVSATCVRVPVFVGHAISIYAEFAADVTVETATACLKEAAGIVLDPLPTPVDADGSDDVYVGRIRPGGPKALNLWAVADNVRRGAATNTVEIAELLIR